MRAIIYTNDGYINIEADEAIRTEDFVLFYKNENGKDKLMAMIKPNEIKRFHLSEKKEEKK